MSRTDNDRRLLHREWRVHDHVGGKLHRNLGLEHRLDHLFAECVPAAAGGGVLLPSRRLHGHGRGGLSNAEHLEPGGRLRSEPVPAADWCMLLPGWNLHGDDAGELHWDMDPRWRLYAESVRAARLRSSPGRELHHGQPGG